MLLLTTMIFIYKKSENKKTLQMCFTKSFPVNCNDLPNFEGKAPSMRIKDTLYQLLISLPNIPKHYTSWRPTWAGILSILATYVETSVEYVVAIRNDFWNNNKNFNFMKFLKLVQRCIQNHVKIPQTSKIERFFKRS